MILPTMLALPKNFSPRWYSIILLILLTVGCFCQKSPLKPHLINKKPNVRPTEKQPATLTLIPHSARLIDSKDFTLKLQHDGGKGAVPINNYHLAITINNTTDALENLTNPTDSRIAYNDARNTPQNSTSISCKLDQLTSTITLAPNVSLTIPFTLVPGASTKKITINIQLKHLKDNTVQTATIAWIASVQERMDDMIASLALTPEEEQTLQDATSVDEILNRKVRHAYAKKELNLTLLKIKNGEEIDEEELTEAIYEATACGSIGTIQALLDYKPNFNLKDQLENPIRSYGNIVGRAPDRATAVFLLENLNLDPLYGHSWTSRGSYGALHRGNLEAIEAMENKNPGQLFSNNQLPFHSVLLNDWTDGRAAEIIEWLLVHYPQFLTSTTTQGQSVLHAVAGNKRVNPPTIRKLIDNVIRKNASLLNKKQNYKGWTAIHIACNRDNSACLAALLLAGAAPELKDDDGNTPLAIAATEGSLASLKLLLTNHADPTKQNNQGNTPLHEAVLSGNVAIVQELVKKPSGKHTIPNNDHKTARQLAVDANNQPIIDLL